MLRLLATLQPQTMPLPTLQLQTMPLPTLQPQTMPLATLQPQTMPLPTLHPQTMPFPTLPPMLRQLATLQPQTMLRAMHCAPHLYHRLYCCATVAVLPHITMYLWHLDKRRFLSFIFFGELDWSGFLFSRSRPEPVHMGPGGCFFFKALALLYASPAYLGPLRLFRLLPHLCRFTTLGPSPSQHIRVLLLP